MIITNDELKFNVEDFEGWSNLVYQGVFNDHSKLFWFEKSDEIKVENIPLLQIIKSTVINHKITVKDIFNHSDAKHRNEEKEFPPGSTYQDLFDYIEIEKQEKYEYHSHIGCKYINDTQTLNFVWYTGCEGDEHLHRHLKDS
jgi:hypothetical protein